MTMETACPINWPTIEESRATDDWEIVPESPSKLPKSVSTPDFGLYTFEDESISCASNSVVIEEDEDVCVIKHDATAPSSVGENAVKVKRVPSFKDAILLNAEETLKEEERRKAAAIEKSRSLTPQKGYRQPKFAIRKISRNFKSTGDLTSLIEHQEEEEEVLGATDASEFYARKSKGNVSRVNSTKLRPDEAKRREYIIYKKNVQRENQR
mmetsp:Transcript_15136/g.22327  ORF Transcript_15136/g.22327 Transcript_15136/m.22327 type:complete len:211 (-) Transcript_15136:41-673(-)